MTQEVIVTIRMAVDTSQSEEDIKDFVEEIINTHTLHSSTHNRMMFPKVNIISIQEEFEIYDNK